MTSFATITPEDYKKLVDNERKIFDLTENFTTPEIPEAKSFQLHSYLILYLEFVCDQGTVKSLILKKQ